MNKRDLIVAIHHRDSRWGDEALTFRQSQRAVNHLLDVIVAQLQEGEAITLGEFGTFRVQVTQVANTDKHGFTNAAGQVVRPGNRRVRIAFKPSKALKRKIKAAIDDHPK